VKNLGECYDKASSLGCIFVNYRFKRRALSKDEALADCMFRVMDIIDPMDSASGAILRLEHEVRSATKPNGSLYKSAPFRDVSALL
jgi:hypothetical protein